MGIGDFSRYPAGTSHVATVADSVALPKEAKRQYARITNDSLATRVYLGFGAAAVVGEGESIGPGQSVVLEPYKAESFLWEADDVHVITASGSAALSMSEVVA